MAFCPYCCNQMNASSGQCPNCHLWVPEEPAFPLPQPTAHTAPASAQLPYGGPSSGFLSPDFIRPRFQSPPGTLRVVFWTAGAMLLIFFGLASVAWRYITDVAAQQTATVSARLERRADHVEAIDRITRVIQIDTNLLQLLSVASNHLTGTLDDQLDKKAQLVRDYVSIAQNVDTKSSAASFADAYNRHLALWSDLAQAYASHPHIPSDEEAFVTRLLQNLSGTPSTEAIERREIAEWVRRVEDAGNRADQGTRDYLDAGKAAMDSAGKDADTGK